MTYEEWRRRRIAKAQGRMRKYRPALIKCSRLEEKKVDKKGRVIGIENKSPLFDTKVLIKVMKLL